MQLSRSARWLPSELLAGWINLVAALGTIATIVVSVFYALNNGHPGWYVFVPFVYICAISAICLIALWRQQRNHRLAQALPTIQEAFRGVAQATYGVISGSAREDAFVDLLRGGLADMAAAFTAITGSKCRASIKLISLVSSAQGKANRDVTPRDWQVTTLCRSDAHHREPMREHEDLVQENTDFKAIFVDAASYYFNNNLVAAYKKGEYENSHWSMNAVTRGTIDYRSAIVWPITHGDLSAQAADAPVVLGFLCIDSADTDVFRASHDVPLGAAFAHALHLAVLTYREQKPSNTDGQPIQASTIALPPMQERQS